MNLRNKRIYLIVLMTLSLFEIACTTGDGGHKEQKNQPKERKTAVLLVNHGSRSETWRNALLDLEKRVSPDIMADGRVKGVKTAFMEYTEPSIATRLKEFDNEGYTDVVIVPVFLTVSTHSFDDIPTIVGMKEDPKSMETLKIEKIERYTPAAKVHIAPLLDFTDILQKNILRRVAGLSKKPGEEGVVLIAYGDHTYNTEWTELLTKVGAYVQANTGVKAFSYGWCGHVASYSSDSTTAAVNRVLSVAGKALVVPVLVAHDEMFQVKIIGDGINKVANNKSRVAYLPDAILPDANVEKWVTDISIQYAGKLANEVAGR